MSDIFSIRLFTTANKWPKVTVEFPFFFSNDKLNGRFMPLDLEARAFIDGANHYVEDDADVTDTNSNQFFLHCFCDILLNTSSADKE